MTGTIVLASALRFCAGDPGTGSADSGTVDSGTPPVDTADTGTGTLPDTGCEATTESCNGVDDDCDGVVDPEGATGCSDYYVDADGDGLGGADGACLCAAADPYVATVGGDCDDADARHGASCSPTARTSADADGVVVGDVESIALGERILLADAGDGPFLVAGLAVDHGPLTIATLPTGTQPLADVTTTTISLGDWRLDTSGVGVDDVDGDGADDLVVLGDQCVRSDGGWYDLCNEYLFVFDLPITAATLDDARVVYQSTGAVDWSAWQATLPGDIDGDGIDDVVQLEDYGNANAVTLVPTHDPGTPYYEEATLLGAADALGGPGDLDGDGMADLVYASLEDSELYVASGPVAPWGLTPSATVAVDPYVTRLEAAGDVDGDGYPDVYVFLRDDYRVHLLAGPIASGALDDVETGVFGDRPDGVVEDYAAFAATDLDEDGFADLAVTDDTTRALSIVYGPWSGSVLPTTADVAIAGVTLDREGSVSALPGGPLAVGASDESLARWGGAVWLFDAP